MKLKSMEMGIYEDNKDVKSLPRSLSFTPCTNSINVTDGGKKKGEGGKDNIETSGVYGSFSDFLNKMYQKTRSIF